MKTFNYLYENLKPNENILKYALKDDILYFDIETTGLSKIKNHIYLIGCGYYSESGLNIIQWFAESETEEQAILAEFNDFASSFNSLINYNGKTFDIPFTTERLSRYGLNMPEFDSTDIFTLVKPLKKLLSLSDLTQKSIESFLGIRREDRYNGGELIYVYKKYVQYRSKSDLEKLLLHNKEDVLNMHYISAMLDYLPLLCCKTTYINHSEKKYKDYNGIEKSEIIIKASHNGCDNLKCFSSFYNNESGSFIINFSNNGSLLIRIPVVREKLKYYLPNYKDYYYIPSENICIFKSMAGGILKENRENAKKENCFVSCEDFFVPAKDKNALPDSVKLFRSDYKSKNEYFRLNDFETMNNDEKSRYINSIFDSFK